MNPSETVEPKKTKLRVIAPPPVIFASVLSLAVVLDLRMLGLPRLPHEARYALWPMLALGVSLCLWAVMVMRRHNTTVNPYGKSTAIVADGPFAFSRNPIYLGFVLVYMGIALYCRSMLALCALPLVILIMHFGVITREEKYLEATFGGPYTSYKSRVRRWL